MIDELDKRIIVWLQGDLPLKSEPFAKLAIELGISQSELIDRIICLANKGIMRRFGVTLRHEQAGFSSNVMVAWRINEDCIEEAGVKFAAQRQVSHCYWRNPHPNFPYNLYTMVHGKNEEECDYLILLMSKKIGVTEYEKFFSLEEFKKISINYHKLKYLKK